MGVERSVLQMSYINTILIVKAANVHWNSCLWQEPLRKDDNKDCRMGKALTFVTITKTRRRWLEVIEFTFLSCFFSKSTLTLFPTFYTSPPSVKCLQRANKVLFLWYSWNEKNDSVIVSDMSFFLVLMNIYKYS